MKLIVMIIQGTEHKETKSNKEKLPYNCTVDETHSSCEAPLGVKLW